MSAPTLAEEGKAALKAKKYDVAIEKLSKAIKISESPTWLVDRAIAYMETRQFDKALRDTEYAYCKAFTRKNGKSRTQMIEAQHRRSVVLFRQKRYADADACAVWAQQLAQGAAVCSADTTPQYIDEKGLYHVTMAQLESEKPPQEENKNKAGEGNSNGDALDRISAIMASSPSNESTRVLWNNVWTWRHSVVRFLEALPADDPARKVTVKFEPEEPSLEYKTEEVKKEEHDPEIEAAKAAPKPAINNGPLRSQTYQTDNQITVTLFMKFANQEATEKVSIEIQPNMVAITGVPREPPTAFIIPHAAIDPSKSSYRVLTMKIELNLVKTSPGKWPTFGEEKSTKPEGFVSSQTTPAAAAASPPPKPETTFASTTTATKPPQEKKAPAYPTSSKKGPKDWDTIGADDDDDENADNDPNDFFRKLYASASPDAQRAMMKSFQESNGTALSTDWDSVSKKTVDTQPPDGMEVKKW